MELRPLHRGDSVDELTELLHRAYASLAAGGMRYLASHQSPRMTRKRIKKGECFVALDGGRIVGTITLVPPGKTAGTPHYDRRDVASFHQFAVDPALQGRGLGARLLALVERRAVELGARELAFDTSEHAAALIAFYGRRGFRFVEHCRWKSVNYRSVVMSKPLAE